MQEVFIVSAKRTPMGSFGGSLSTVTAPKLGAVAIKSAVTQAGLSPENIEEIFMGNVIQANNGQAPARQAAIFGGLNTHTICTTVNKVCASGMKSIIFGAQSIQLGQNGIVVAGGMESMSQVPFYVPKARYGYGYGHGELVDGLLKDGLTDVYQNKAMGCFADLTASELKITREEQDAFAIQSYKRSADAWANGRFDNEIAPVEITDRRGNVTVVNHDEEYKNVNFDKLTSLKAVFSKDGTVTAGNASTINDGASALVLASAQQVKELGLKPIGRVVSYADGAHEPEWFTTAPTIAAKKALQRAQLEMKDISYFEVNEAFAVVTMAFAKSFGLSFDNINVNGGAVSLGHPLGSSGSRIIVTLLNVLHQKNARYGMAAICNGGGGASAMIIEKL